MPGIWSEEDDRKLWSMRSKPTKELASTFAKTNGAIRSRLKHLQNPEHKAYKRRVGASPPAQHSIFASCQSYGTSSTCCSSSVAKLSSSSRAIIKSESLVGSAAPLDPTTATLLLRTPKPSVHSSSSRQQKQRIQEHTLNADQKAASEYVFSGGNAFLTGAAGVGKSYLLNYIIQGLRDQHERRGGAVGTEQNQTVVVAAATGVAATHIDGVTVHSWSGVRLGKGGARVLVPRVLQNEAACRRWREARVLVLDEVSMIDGILFETLDAIGREVRGCPSKPFGGVQLVLSGDFFQLPPVSLDACGFAFESPAWRKASVKTIELSTIVRQSGDQSFVHILNQIRVGSCPAIVTYALEACHISRKPLPVDGIVPTKLYCTNRNVDDENNRNLAHLPGKEMLFPASDSFKGNYNADVQRNISQFMDRKVPSELRLKVNAQVILTRNMPNYNLVNGSRGVVASFEERKSDFVAGQNNHDHSSAVGTKKLYPIVHFSNGVEMMVREESVFQGGSSGAMVRSQLPLKLAWSLTVHKSQGMTIERAELQLDDAFDYGQAYVALSRVTSLEGLWVRGGRITQSVVKAHPKVRSFYEQTRSAVLAQV